MKILHLHLNGPFTENWGYQENVISEEHKRLGHEVIVITNCFTYNDEGIIIESYPIDKIMDNGVRLIRIKKKKLLLKKFEDIFRPYKIYKLLCNINPDFIFIHGLIGSIGTLDVVKYVKRKNHNCDIVVDIHQDYCNSPINKTIKYNLLKFILRRLNAILIKYVKKIFYVRPSTKIYAENYYNVPSTHLEFLPLCSDFRIIHELEKDENVTNFRYTHSFSNDDILICHGGKLDSNKKTIELVNAVEKLNDENPRVKLLIFGPILNDINDILVTKIENSNFITYFGRLKVEEYYKLFLSSDIAVFPGGHSVLWEEALSCGLAMLVTKIYGAENYDLGGNVKYLEFSTSNEILLKLKEIITKDKYKKMKMISKRNAENIFSYEAISKKVLEYSRFNKTK